MAVQNHLEREDFRGTFPVALTLMKSGGKVCYPAQDILIGSLVESGVEGIVILGTTGQGACFDYGQHIGEVRRTKHILDTDFPHKDIKLIVGAGTNDTTKAVELAQRIEDVIGPTTFLEATGSYLKIPPEAGGLHYEELARGIRGNIIIYNVSGRTGFRLTPRDISFLTKEHPGKFIGLKQAEPAYDDETRKIIEADVINVVSGEDDGVVKIAKMGGQGVISASANACPKYFVAMTNAALAGDFATAEEYERKLMPFVKLAFSTAGLDQRGSNNPIALSKLFEGDLRGSNASLDRILGYAVREAEHSNDYTRVNAIQNLIINANRLATESNPAETGMNFEQIRELLLAA